MLGCHRHHRQSTRHTLQSLAIAGKENAKRERERQRERERERSGSASSSSVEVQRPRSRCQVFPEEVQKLDFLAFLSEFKPKVPREVLSRSLRFFLSAQGSSCLLAEPENSDRNAFCLPGDFGAFCWELFQVDENLTGVLWQSYSS